MTVSVQATVRGKTSSVRQAGPDEEAQGERRSPPARSPHGPTRTRSVCSAVVTAGALPRVTVAEPPPAGTAIDPLALVTPLLTAAWSVAPPQAAGRPPT